MKFSKSEFSYLLISILLFLFFSYLLYKELNRQGDIGNRKIVGTITFKHKVAQRKLDDSVIWDELAQKVSVYNRDSIRTEDQSEAVIELVSGVKIQLQDNSMIILDINEQGEANINFNYGTIKANSESGSGNSSVNIISGDKIISLDQSDISLKKDQGEGILDFIVNKGKAILKTEENGKQVKQEINENEKINITGETIELAAVPITLINPSNSERDRVFTDKVPADLNLSWKNPNNAKNLKLEISSDPNFSRIIQKKDVAGDNENIQLPEGTFYWRIVGIDEKTGEAKSSESQKISVLEKKKIKLITPSPNSAFTYVNQEPFISFLWDEDKSASGYILEISSDSEFKNIVKSVDTLTTSISYQLKDGEYNARVTTKSRFPQSVQTSNSVRFAVQKRLTLPPPVPLKPAESEKMSSEFLRKNGYIFTWLKPTEISETNIVIAKDPIFSDVVVNASEANNFYLLQNVLPPGKYYWRIRGKDAVGNTTDFSRTLAFKVSSVENIMLVSPANNETLEAFQSVNGVRFSWSDSEVKPPYLLEIASDANFSNPVKKMEVNDKNIQLKDLESKKYFWRVLKKDPDGVLAGSSEIQNFTVKLGIDEPEPIFPSPNKAVDMSNENYLSMKWDKVPEASSYRVKLYRVDNGKLSLIFQTNTTEQEYKYRNMEKLDKGSFIWSVTAETNANNKISKSGEVKTGFSITLPDSPPPRIISPNIQVIEE